jgi:uncharacterized protein (TIGR02118 family)
MVKAVSFFKRNSGMPVEEFQAYWRGNHPAPVRRLPGVRRYVQSHTLLAGYRKGEPLYDGIAEVWFEDTKAMHTLRGTQELETVEADEAAFIDRSTMRMILTEEHVIKDGPVPTDGVKSIEFVTRKPGLDVEPFQRYWREVHGPIAAQIPMIRRYVQSHTRRSGYDRGRTPAYDGVAITWFDDTQAMRAAAATDQYARVRTDEPNFLAPGDAPFIITREHVIVP